MRREVHSTYHAKLSNARKSTESCVLSRAPQSRKCSSRLDRLQSSIVPWSDLSVAQFYLFSVQPLNNCSARQNLWPPATGKPSFPRSHRAKCRWLGQFSTKYCPSSSSCFRRNILALPLQCGGLPLRRSLILTMCRNSGRKLWYEVGHPSLDILWAAIAPVWQLVPTQSHNKTGVTRLRAWSPAAFAGTRRRSGGRASVPVVCWVCHCTFYFILKS